MIDVQQRKNWPSYSTPDTTLINGLGRNHNGPLDATLSVITVQQGKRLIVFIILNQVTLKILFLVTVSVWFPFLATQTMSSPSITMKWPSLRSTEWIVNLLMSTQSKCLLLSVTLSLYVPAPFSYSAASHALMPNHVIGEREPAGWKLLDSCESQPRNYWLRWWHQLCHSPLRGCTCGRTYYKPNCIGQAAQWAWSPPVGWHTCRMYIGYQLWITLLISY